MIIEILVDGEEFTMDAANSMNEAGKIIAMRKQQIKDAGYSEDVAVLIDGVERTQSPFMTDVKAVAKNMKTQWIENKIMGDTAI